MKIVKLKGGLGNQMFQYAFAKIIEQKTKETVKLDFSSYTGRKNDSIRVPRLTKFNISLDTATDSDITSVCIFPHKGDSLSFKYKVGIYLEKTFNKKYFFEPDRSYRNPDNLLKYDYFDGYWQAYKLIDYILPVISKDFLPINPLSDKTSATQSVMKEQQAVFVGVRKGDYEAQVSHYGSFSEEYYISAMEKIETQIENPIYYIFSNDIEWCKNNLHFGNRNVIYREKENQTDDFEELILMSSCKHAIIINSSYHWWGATLIQNPDKIIICPDKWFFDGKPIDIIPPYWTKQEVK